MDSSGSSSKISNPEIAFSSDEDNAGLFYYEDPTQQMPYNLDDIELSYIEDQIQQHMMNGQIPLGPIRSASTGSDNCDNYKDKISSLLGGTTKDTSSGKENLEYLNNDESSELTHEMYKLTEKLAFGSPSQMIKLQDERFIRPKDLARYETELAQQEKSQEEIQEMQEISIA